MERVLELCIELDTEAERIYHAMAAGCPDAAVSQLFDVMAGEEHGHIGWWREIRDAWRDGLVPEVLNDTDELVTRLEGIARHMSEAHGRLTPDCGTETMLALAGQLEFHMLDPVFAELLELTEPARAGSRLEAYERHVDRLVEALESHAEPGSVIAFLAMALRRTWRDNRALASFAMRDQLTGLHNRRSLAAYLEQWAAWANRYGHPLAVAMIDVDGLKTINDTHGHGTGDDALVAVAAALREAVRASDVVARYGGDEFAVVAPETDRDDLAALLDRIVACVHETSLADAEGTPVALSVSVGGAVARGGSTPTDLLAAADGGLYEAKRAGRDRATPPAVLGD
ncbi:MAG: diguanylate cyclase [Coriobacteriia bacterium]